jgi:hypothetical protein
MGFELRHPVGMTTHVFNPGVNADVETSGQERINSVIAKRMDDFTLYRYSFAPSGTWIYTRGLSTLTVSGMTDLESFFAAVSGEFFDFTDGECGPITDWVTVKLTEQSEVSRPWRYAAGGRVEVVFSMLAQPD